jgi:hypothetical protein
MYLECQVDRRVALPEDEVGVAAKPGDDMAAGKGGDVKTDLEPGLILSAQRHEAFVVRMAEGFCGRPVSGDEVGECPVVHFSLCRRHQGNNEDRKIPKVL